MCHPDISQDFPDNRLPALAAGDSYPAFRMALLEDPDTCAALPDHGFIPFRDLGRPDGECLLQLLKIWSKRGFEEEGCIECIAVAAVKSNKDIFSNGEPAQLSLVAENLGPPAAFVTPVKEPPFRNAVMYLEFRCMTKQRPVPGKELRVSPAPLIHEFP
jgi:hypothetical protein